MLVTLLCPIQICHLFFWLNISYSLESQVFFKDQEKILRVHTCESTRNDPQIGSHNSANFSNIFIAVRMCAWSLSQYLVAITVIFLFFLLNALDQILKFSNQVATFIKLPKMIKNGLSNMLLESKMEDWKDAH